MMFNSDKLVAPLYTKYSSSPTTKKIMRRTSLVATFWYYGGLSLGGEEPESRGWW
jgi:hypothetical protein